MSNANVLLVDDEASFVETFAERLELRNFEISKAFSGEEALRILKENQTVELLLYVDPAADEARKGTQTAGFTAEQRR